MSDGLCLKRVPVHHREQTRHSQAWSAWCALDHSWLLELRNIWVKEEIRYLITEPEAKGQKRATTKSY